jgi:hypothetical protein
MLGTDYYTNVLGATVYAQSGEQGSERIASVGFSESQAKLTLVERAGKKVRATYGMLEVAMHRARNPPFESPCHTISSEQH